MGSVFHAGRSTSSNPGILRSHTTKIPKPDPGSQGKGGKRNKFRSTKQVIFGTGFSRGSPRPQQLLLAFDVARHHRLDALEKIHHALDTEAVKNHLPAFVVFNQSGVFEDR